MAAISAQEQSPAGLKRLALHDLASVPIMKKLWQREIRKQLRAVSLQEIYLAKDPLEYLPFEWELSSHLAGLQQQVSQATYRASPTEVLRGAKGQGLTRPLAFLTLGDQILFKLIIARAQGTLLRNSRPWTRLGRFTPGEEQGAPESGWFRNFILRQGQLWRITANHEWVVETDVANFFPYVHLPSVLAHMHSDSNLAEDVVRLLEHMLIEFSPLNSYRRLPTTGLPQENFNCSRVIAHTYLRVVDDEFEEEGQGDRYSRFMDDIVVGAQTFEEALGQVQRVQAALERVGLYPNTAKTRIIRRDDFTKEWMKEENDYLGTVEDAISANTVAFAEFDERLKVHLRRKSRPPRAWSRVLRRYYTISRRLRNRRLLDYAFNHLVEQPDSARSILDYLSTFRLTHQRLNQLVDALDRMGGVYEDVSILCFEYVCQAPNQNSPSLRKQIADWSLETFSSAYPKSPRLASVAGVALGKFGGAEHMQALDVGLETYLRGDHLAGRQALVILLG